VESFRRSTIGPASNLENPLHQSFFAKRDNRVRWQRRRGNIGVKSAKQRSVVTYCRWDVRHIAPRATVIVLSNSFSGAWGALFFTYVTVPSTDAATASLVAAIKDNVLDAGFPIESLYFNATMVHQTWKGNTQEWLPESLKWRRRQYTYIATVIYYAALLSMRGPHIVSHSVCVSVCPSVPLSLQSVTSRHLANYNDTHVIFGTRWGHPFFSARTEGRISYGHLGRTDSC